MEWGGNERRRRLGLLGKRVKGEVGEKAREDGSWCGVKRTRREKVSLSVIGGKTSVSV